MNHNPTQERNHRQAVIDGLRELADFFEQHPDVPVPLYPELTYHAYGSDEAQRAEVDRIATVLDTTTKESANGDHYSAARTFRGLTYEALAITAERMRRHQAGQSYAGVVQPDDEAVSV